ncbi:hypothetical protein [Streptomyces sp. NPDC050504]|uniref:hypothetical protein n=1 Tax=Streptomyces sp. NPDC050504 TaxID=3365618 RepID=UPI0037B7E6A7
MSPSPSRPSAPASSATATATAPRAGGWLLRGKDGRLTAYAPAKDGLLRWTERPAREGGWTAPDFIDAPALLGLAVAQGPSGYVHLFVQYRKGKYPQLKHAMQYQTGRPVGPWFELGNPHRNHKVPGPPVAAVDADDAVHLLIGDIGHGVHLRRQNKAGKWLWWEDLPDSVPTAGPVACGVLSDGRIEFLAPEADGVLGWQQKAAHGPFDTAKPAPATAEPGSLGALLTSEGGAGDADGEEAAGGGVTYYWHDRDGGGVMARTPGGETVSLGGSPGGGAVTAVRTVIEGQDCTVLAHRGADGRPAVAAFATGTETEVEDLVWQSTGEPCLGTPALALDGADRLVAAAIGTDGTLRVARQKDEPGLALAAWQRI